jgi:DNA-binding MarR family transcriptional regulator
MDQQDSADAVVSTIRQIIRSIDLQSKQLTKKYGLTGPQLIVLKEIYKSPGKKLSEISRQVSLSQATVTSILDRLEQQGFVERQRDITDKRKVNVLLNEKAQNILKTNPSLFQEEFSNRFEQLAEWEKSMILSSLQRLSEMLNAENIQSPPILTSGPLAASSQEVNRYLNEEQSSSLKNGEI